MVGLPVTIAVVARELVVNGDFARGAAPGPWITVRPGQSAIAAWRVQRNDVDYVGSYWTTPQPGSRSVNLDGAPGPAGGAIAQTLATTPGRRYRLRFTVAPNPEGPPAIKGLRVSAGAQHWSYVIPTPAGTTRFALPWAEKSVTFTATSAATELVFASLDRGRYLWNGPILTAISVVPDDGAAPSETAAPVRTATAAPATTAPATAAPATAPPATAKPAAPRPAISAAVLGPYSGGWLGAYPQRPVRLRFDTHGQHVVGTVLEGAPTFAPGTIALEFDVRGMSLVGLARCPGGGGAPWHGATYARTGADQLVLTIADCRRGTVQLDRVR